MQPILSKDSANEWNDKIKWNFIFHSRVQPILFKVVQTSEMAKKNVFFLCHFRVKPIISFHHYRHH